nr:calcium-binding protein [Trichothermofontia sichuanensis]
MISGGNGKDTLRGGDGNDYLMGNDGDDSINGGAGADTIEGGNGNDLIDGELGADLIYGNESNDTIYAGEYCERCPLGPDDTVFGGKGNDWIYGESGDDLLYGETENDHIFGGDGNDTIDGGLDDDDLFGGAGNDLILGSGSASEDRIAGGTGDDVLYGGPGNDSFRGGPGIDTIYLNNSIYIGVLPAADGANDVVAYNAIDVQTIPIANNNGTFSTLAAARAVADTVLGFVPGTITAPAAFPVSRPVPGIAITATPGEDQVSLDPVIANLPVAGVAYFTTIPPVIPGLPGLNITQFVTPTTLGSLLWVDQALDAGTGFLDPGDTIVAWFEGALLTPADIYNGVSDLPA